MERNPRKTFLNALHGNPSNRIPALSVTQTGTVELMDITGAAWPEAHSNPEKMAALAIAGYEIAGLEAVRYPYCLTVLAEIMGCDVRMGTKDIQPSVLSHPFAKGPENLRIPENLLEKGRIPTVLRATEILATWTGNGIQNEIPLIAGMEGPLTVFTHLAEVKNCLIWALKKPDYFKVFMETCTEICIEYANSLFDRGADALCVPDGGIVGSRMMPPSVLEDSVKPFYKRLCERVNGPVILHICGDVGDSLRTLSECGFEAISIEEKASIKAAKEAIGGRARLIGNVSPSRTLLFGTPDAVKAEAKRCLSAGVDILAPGCGIAPRTPLANIRALVEARDEWYKEKE
jgi:[methyl-Co(III) methanol-specific corrinoid protein]:coenzyme M methyltransferase